MPKFSGVAHSRRNSRPLFKSMGECAKTGAHALRIALICSFGSRARLCSPLAFTSSRMAVRTSRLLKGVHNLARRANAFDFEAFLDAEAGLRVRPMRGLKSVSRRASRVRSALRFAFSISFPNTTGCSNLTEPATTSKCCRASADLSISSLPRRTSLSQTALETAVSVVCTAYGDSGDE